jgi:alpha-tubulin suppressor-like RCC1 family protein
MSEMDPVVQVACGVWHTALVTVMGAVYVCGLNSFGQLGLGNDDADCPSSFKPRLVELPEEAVAVGVACGARHTVALTTDGRVFTWGDNTFGQCDPQRSATKTVTSPSLLLEPVNSMSSTDVIADGSGNATGTAQVVRSVAAGHWHTLLLVGLKGLDDQ